MENKQKQGWFRSQPPPHRAWPARPSLLTTTNQLINRLFWHEETLRGGGNVLAYGSAPLAHQEKILKIKTHGRKIQQQFSLWYLCYSCIYDDEMQAKAFKLKQSRSCFTLINNQHKKVRSQIACAEVFAHMISKIFLTLRQSSLREPTRTVAVCVCVCVCVCFGWGS